MNADLEMQNIPEESGGDTVHGSIRSLKDLIEEVTAAYTDPVEQSDLGQTLPPVFPFPALVGQVELKLALTLAVINPAVGGVLILGPRGTGKTTAVRSLVDLLPEVEVSLCPYGCLPEELEAGGMDAVCPDCAKKYGQGLPLTRREPARLVELPLNARLEDVVGGLDERAALHRKILFKRGLLSTADRGILYVDEVNLLPDELSDALLDAAATGHFIVRRGPVSASYRSRFTLIGSMNPEEGQLRPQIFDRFGLRVVSRGLRTPEERLAAYRQAISYQRNPVAFCQGYQDQVKQLRERILAAREFLPQVTLPEPVALGGMHLIERLKIHSLRVDISLFEAARAHAAYNGCPEVSIDNLSAVAPLALRLRRSTAIQSFLDAQDREEHELQDLLDTSLE